MTKPIISHSEVESFVLCERRHFYGHGLKLSPKSMSQALSRAILGHDIMLMRFFKKFKETEDFELSLQEVDKALLEALINPDNDPRTVNEIARITKGWLRHFEDRIKFWEIVSVEETKKLDMGEFVFAYTTDLVILERGYRTVIDFKFVYDFYSGDLLTLLPQIPRYIGAERAEGLPTRFGKYGFVRTRNLKSPGPNDLYRLEPLTQLTTAQIQQSFKEVFLALSRITELKDMGLEEWEDNITANRSVWVCKTCPFKRLCAADFAGTDTTLMKMTEFEPSTYGYKVTDE